MNMIYCQDRDGVRIFKILFTFIYITNHNENRITTKSISSSNGFLNVRSLWQPRHVSPPPQSVSLPWRRRLATWPADHHIWPENVQLWPNMGSSRLVDQSRDITWRPWLRCSQAWRQCLFSACMLPRTDHLWPTSVTRPPPKLMLDVDDPRRLQPVVIIISIHWWFVHVHQTQTASRSTWTVWCLDVLRFCITTTREDWNLILRQGPD